MKSTTPTIRPLTAADIPHVLPPDTSGTVRGFVAELDGKIVGSMGVLHGDVPLAFSTMSDEMRKYPKLVVRAIKMLREMLAKHYTFVMAMASNTEDSTHRVLERVGFRPYLKATEDHRGIYTWQIQ